MPNQYDFSQLDPREFEFLCRDLLQRKLSEECGRAIFLNSFGSGPDKGIDAIFTSEKESIILQCKRFNNFNSLFSHLKYSELPKVFELAPERYILATSIDLTVSQTQKILQLFTPFIRNLTDITGRSFLNNLLNAYPEIELNYPRLFLNSGSILNRLLHANVYNQSTDKLRYFQHVSRFYANDGSFIKALRILEKNRYIVISGEPGVGKSTLAGMISLYYFKQEYEFVFIRRSISEGEGGVWKDNKKQIFLFDDFLGSTTFEGFDRNEDRQLLEFINKVNVSSDKLLLITTREYVFKQAEFRYPEIKKLQITKCLIRQNGFTRTFKINILYNYLYYYAIELEHIRPFLYNEYFKQIIDHRNFTPRLIDDYLRRYYDANSESFSLFYGLNKYLNDPYKYWEEIFQKLNKNAQLLLLILVITEEPAVEEMIFETFSNVGQYRKVYEKGFERDSFENAIEELSNSFISIYHNPEMQRSEGSVSLKDYSLIFTPLRTSRYIEFQNPSIKDFVANYLRQRPDLVEYLIQGAHLFNQLFFIFTSREDDIHVEEEDARFPFMVGKIYLTHHLQAVLIEKILKDFDVLPIGKIKKVYWQGGVTYHPDADIFINRMEKLWLLCRYFPLEKNEIIRNFVTRKYDEILKEDRIARKDNSADSKLQVLSLTERLIQVDIVKKLTPFVQFNPVIVINEFISNIRFSSEYIILHDFEEIFPEEYKQIVTNNIINVRRKIKELIYDDIDYYLWEGTKDAEDAIDELIDTDLEILMETYKFKLSKKFKENINEMSGRALFHVYQSDNKDERLEDIVEGIEEEGEELEFEMLSEQKYQAYESALNRLIPNEVRWEQEIALEYFKEKTIEHKDAGKLFKSFESNACYEIFFENSKLVDLLIPFIEVNHAFTGSTFNLYEQVLLANGISLEELDVLQVVANELYLTQKFVFRIQAFEKYLVEVKKEKNLEINRFSNIILENDIWNSFLSRELHCFFVARYILSLPVEVRKKIYSELRNDFYTYYTNVEILWPMLFEEDKFIFWTEFIYPSIQKEISYITSDNELDVAIKLISNLGSEVDYELWEEEETFEINCTTGGSSVLEDIFRVFEQFNIEPLTFKIEECFNISYIKNEELKKFIERNYPVQNKTYSINLPAEVGRKDFQEILKHTEVITLANKYLAKLRELLNMQVNSIAS